MIDGYTKVLGVLGAPVEHTKSPAIHNMLAKELNLNVCYLPFHVEREDLQAAVKGAHGLGILGLNITVPHKEAVMEGLVEIDALAKQIGAVNTLVKVPGGYKGYNTDMPGLLRAMEDDQVILQGARVVILGAGGVARAVAMLFAKNGAASIQIYNRTVEKAQAIAKEVNELTNKEIVTAYPMTELQLLDARYRYLVIQATNIGMYPKEAECICEDPDFYKLVEVGYDLIYRPLKTRFMEQVEAAGGRAYNGLKMLLYQGIIAFELWNNISVSKELADKVYMELLATFEKNEEC